MFRQLIKPGCTALLIASLALPAVSMAETGERYSSWKQNATPVNQTILRPGWRSSCDTSFVIENLGKKPAEVKITLGKDGLINDRIPQWNKRGYDLVYSLSFAKQLGKSVDIDDVAMIENLSKDSKVSVHC